MATRGPNQRLDWLVNCSESVNCTLMTDWCRLGDCGICVNISPCHLIHSLSPPLAYRAWSMRLDLQCNGIKHIVSHPRARRIEPINPPPLDLPGWKVDQEAVCTRGGKDCVFPAFRFGLLSKRRARPRVFPALLLSIRSAVLSSGFFGKEEREWVKRGHHQENKGADVTGVVFSPRSLSCNLYGSRRVEIHTPSLRSLLWQLRWRLLSVSWHPRRTPTWNLIRRNKIICLSL